VGYPLGAVSDLCEHQAILIVTQSVEGTASNVAKRRVEMRCGEIKGHQGPHRDPARSRTWEDRGTPLTHIIDHEDEAAD
jgi:hypothetical protein